MSTTNKAKIVLGYVVDPENNLLFLHRNDRDEREGVKGGIEVGETYVQAMRRELREETGLQKEDIQNIETIPFFKQTSTYTGFVGEYFCLYTTTLKPTIVINHEQSVVADHDRFVWISLDQIHDLVYHSSFDHEQRTILCDYLLGNKKSL